MDTTRNGGSSTIDSSSQTTLSSSFSIDTSSSSTTASTAATLPIPPPPSRSAMAPKLLGLSFLTILTLALGVHAYKSHLQGKNPNQNHHHELAAAVVSQQCRTRGRPASASLVQPASFESVVVAANPAAAPASAASFVAGSTTSRLVTSFKPTATASSVNLESSPSPIVLSPPSSATHATQSVGAAPVVVSTPPKPAAGVVVSTESVVIDDSEAGGAPSDNNDETPTQSEVSRASSFTPNGIKAGIAGGDSYPDVKDHIGWWYDWSPTPSKPGKPIAVPMLWAGGTADAQDAARLAAFKNIATPVYVLGFEEPDCAPGSGSAGMSVADGVAKWEKYMAPLKAKGAKLGSPSMCKQADETWLAEFAKKIKTPWDFTCIHVNKNSLDGVKKDIDHYKKYNKPIWVTEFACVADNPNFVPCTNQAQINNFINTVVPYFESNKDIYAYAYSNGLGLGNVWPMTTSNGKLSASGKTYLAAISKYH